VSSLCCSAVHILRLDGLSQLSRWAGVSEYHLHDGHKWSISALGEFPGDTLVGIHSWIIFRIQIWSGDRNRFIASSIVCHSIWSVVLGGQSNLLVRYL